MAITKQNFEMWQGDDKRITFTITNADGTAKSLVGSTVEWILYVSTAQQVLKSTILSNIIIIGNKAQVILDSIDTVNIRAGQYEHECRVTDTSNITEVVSTGIVTLNNSRTR